jgi:peroxiredoxin
MNTAQTEHVKEVLGLNYPLYSDPSWDMFEAYGVGYSLGAPKASWVIIDAEGTVQWAWRRLGETGRVPTPLEALDMADQLFGGGTTGST